MTLRRNILTVALLAAASLPARALEIDPNVVPEINIAGRGVVSVDAARDNRAGGGKNSEGTLNTADSSLLFGFSKYLSVGDGYSNYGFGVIGFKLPDDDADLKDDIYIHEANVGVGGKNYEVKLGRSRLGNTLIQFPTIRDDDLLGYTYVLNGSANAEAEEYQQFGGVAQGTWWFTPIFELTGGLTARTETDAAGARISTADFNGGFLGIAYDVPEAIKFDRGLRYAGIRLDSQRVQGLGAGLPSDRMNALIGALVLNLSDNPEATWNLDLQAIANDGASVTSLAPHAARARAQSEAFTAALRYGHRPALQTRWQAALTLGWKDYSDFTDAKATVIAPSYGYRLGSGVEFLAQYVYTKYDGALATGLNLDRKQQVQLGLIFSFDHTFNESVGERKSILNLEHNMFDIGPLGGGH